MQSCNTPTNISLFKVLQIYLTYHEALQKIVTILPTTMRNQDNMNSFLECMNDITISPQIMFNHDYFPPK